MQVVKYRCDIIYVNTLKTQSHSLCFTGKYVNNKNIKNSVASRSTSVW